MSNEPTTLEIAKLAGVLKETFEAAVQRDEEIQTKILARQDDPIMLELQEEMMEFALEGAGLMLDHTQEEAEEKLASKGLPMLEKMFAFAVDVCGEETVKGYVFAKDQSEAVSTAFEAHNAPTLAKLYAPR